MTTQFLRRTLASLALITGLLAGSAQATVNLRVEGRPSTDPIQAFVRVTNAGAPVTGLTSADFIVTIDGVNVPLQPTSVTLPPAEDPNQHVSIVFVMDYSSSVLDVARDAMETAVIEFINTMKAGDMAAIIKFNLDTGPNVVIPFTAIDDGGANDTALHDAVIADYPGDGSPLLDATNLGVAQFTGVTLPDGPKAVILVTDGRENQSTNTSEDVIGAANSGSIPIFTIGVGNPNQNALDLLGSLAHETGGQFFPAPTEQAISDAYASVSALLTSEYLISIPDSSITPITDCAEHQLEVTVTGNSPVTVLFTRRQCDTVPNAFTFTNQTNVGTGLAVTSNTATITGLEVPAHISVIEGTYAIGCGATFTNTPGTISDGQTVCVRHTASDQPSTARTTTLTIGGVAGTFTSTTRAASGGGGGGGGGGGATGLPELLLGLGALLLGRRRRAA